jgi:hypothetical protein
MHDAPYGTDRMLGSVGRRNSRIEGRLLGAGLRRVRVVPNLRSRREPSCMHGRAMNNYLHNYLVAALETLFMEIQASRRPRQRLTPLRARLCGTGAADLRVAPWKAAARRRRPRHLPANEPC